MFRPLLSSVPSTTFYVGKTSSTHSITLRNSSITTGSNMSSDRGANVLPDSESNYYNRDDVAGDSGKMLCADTQEEIFAFDEANEDLGSVLCGDIDRGHLTEGGPIDSNDIEVCDAQVPVPVRDDLSEVDDLGSTMLCSLCGCRYDATDLIEMEIRLCKECRMKENFPSAIFQETLAVAADKPPVMASSTPVKSEDPDSLAIAVSESPQIVEMDESKYNGTHLSDDSPSVPHVEVPEVIVANDKGKEQLTGGWGLPVRGTGSQESEHFSNHPNTKVTAAEGAGISLLLKRSSSTKGLVVQGRALAASTILPHDDLSYSRETTTSMRSSMGHRSFSSSSSIDLSLSRQSETRVQRQFSGRRSDIENYRYEVKSQSVESSSISGTSSHSHQAMGLVTTTSGLNIEGSVGDMNKSLSSETAVSSLDQQPGLDVAGTNPLSTHSAVIQKDNSEHGESGRKMDASALLLSSGVAMDGLGDDFSVCRDNIQETTELENCEDLQENARNETNLKASSAMENATSDTCVSILNEMSASTNVSLVSTSEIEAHDSHHCGAISEVFDKSPDSKIPMDEFQEPLKKDTDASTPVPISSDPVVDISGQSSPIPLYFDLKAFLWPLLQ